MPKTTPAVKSPSKETPKQEEEKKAPDLSVPIAMGVLAQLGKPKNLHEVQVHHLWDNRYRVNVWVVERHKRGIYGDNTFGLIIKHSYFIWASPEGGIINSNPPIERVYKKRLEGTQSEEEPCAEESENSQ